MEQNTDTAITTAEEFRALAKYAGQIQKELDSTTSDYVLSQMYEQVTSLVNHSLNVIVSMDMWSHVNDAVGKWINETNQGRGADTRAGIQPASDMLLTLHWALLLEATRA